MPYSGSEAVFIVPMRHPDRSPLHLKALKFGNGLEPGTTMGPLVNDRRVAAMEGFVADAVQKGAAVVTGGKRHGNKGYFFEPTMLTGIPPEARVPHERPYGREGGAPSPPGRGNRRVETRYAGARVPPVRYLDKPQPP